MQSRRISLTTRECLLIIKALEKHRDELDNLPSGEKQVVQAGKNVYIDLIRKLIGTTKTKV